MGTKEKVKEETIRGSSRMLRYAIKKTEIKLDKILKEKLRYEAEREVDFELRTNVEHVNQYVNAMKNYFKLEADLTELKVKFYKLKEI